ncbi:baseplate J/gp47 family protein [Flavobacterium humi]|uniref:Uncharacterized protein n=1 Tax=Flavobacterium humi TaxID=2562683 RepID=A0A4Z0L4U8_9FLAO|nr:baseplate J/gp47 family protein [Flavobacterium humi]TGD57501.1 hypothetical protein E4635_09920 [Flavobacterium humi]
MKNCNAILSIHEGMGTTQNDRINPALQPDFFLLDERDEQDFILFVQRLSQYVKFYNEFNLEEGNWSNFFQKESTSILILIANWNIELLQSSFENKKNEILLNNDFPSQQALLLEYFTQIRTAYQTLLEKAKTLDEDIPEKENLVASSYLITDKFAIILDQVNNATDIEALLKNYVFVKTTQQLFGLLLSWKDFSQNAVTHQLSGYSKHTPHYALFLSFLKLLNIAKEKFNELTKKHLDFYYKDVLHIQNQKARPDYVHLVVEPFDAKPFLVPKDTVFIAGKNSAGQKKFYASTADQTVNGIKLHSFISTHRRDEQYYKVPDLLPFNAKSKGFDVFAAAKQDFKEGIMIASPILYMQSGERIIYLRFNDYNYKAEDFDFYITGEEKTIAIKSKQNVKKNNNSNEERIKLTLPAAEKAIIPFDAKKHLDFLVQSDFPVLKIIPKNRKVMTKILKIDINIEVNKFKSFVLESDFGTIDTEKAFYPFGEIPKNGNGVMLRSNEYFMKNKAVAALTFSSGSSKNSDKKKNDGKPNIKIPWLTNKVDMFQFTNGTWKEYSEGLKPISNDYPLKEYHFDEIITEEITANGKIRIELNYSKYSGETYLQDFIKASQDKTTLPYKPRVKEFIFDYTLAETIDLSTRKNEENPIELFQVLPFGYAKLNKGPFYFSTMASLQGEVYLGFEKAAPKDGLSFLLQLEEGTANPQLEPAKIVWEYLDGNIWTPLEQDAIGDETYSLTQSGLVWVTIPEFNPVTNTKLPSGLFWLKISVSNIEAICKFIGVHAQALKAVLTDYENSGAVFLENTPKETISKVYNPINSIKKITQPYNSFGGKTTERDESLYTRTSERLRHKNRAITSWDYERIILQEFPEVFRLKTLNHYRYDTKISNVSAGYVTLIPIAKSSNSEHVNWRPLLSLNKMLLIKEHLSKIASPHARINVKPPKLEKVQIQFKVKFHIQEGMDTRLYIAALIETINTYLSPWAYNATEVNFANEIEFSSIIQLIDNQPYVDYLTDFKVKQYILNEKGEIVGGPVQNLNKIMPQTDFTLFVPNEYHQIQEI